LGNLKLLRIQTNSVTTNSVIANKKIFLVGSSELRIGFLNIGKRERDKCFHSVNLIKTESQITVNEVSCISKRFFIILIGLML
jgi:hypothetical protein